MPTTPTPSQVTSAVSSTYGIAEEMLYTKTGGHAISEPRQIVLILFNSLLEMTLFKCVQPFGMNYTTVCTSRKTVRNLYDTDKNFRQKFDQVLTALGLSEIQKSRLIKKIRKVNHPKKAKRAVSKLIHSNIHPKG